MTRAHPYHLFVYCLFCAHIWPYVVEACHTSRANGKYVSFPQTAIIEKCRGHAANPYLKYTASSSSLLTRLGLMHTSSPRTFNAFITLATAIHCYFDTGGRFFNGKVSSQFTDALATTLLARDARRGNPHSNGLCRFSEFRNVLASTWLPLWLDSRMSTYGAEVAQATPPNVSIASNTWICQALKPHMWLYVTVICHAHE